MIVTQLIATAFLLTGSAYADDRYVVSSPPQAAPAELNAFGREVWASLVEGRPRFRNWARLMTDTVANVDDRAQVTLIKTYLARWSATSGSSLTELYADTIANEVVLSPTFRALKIDWSAPATDILKSFDELRRSDPTERTRPVARAERLARHDFFARHRGLTEARLNPNQVQELKRLTWRYAQIPDAKPGGLTEKAFDAWRARVQIEIDELRTSAERELHRAIVADAELFPALTFLVLNDLKSGGPRPLSSRYARGAVPPLAHLADATQVVARGFDPPGPHHHAIGTIDDPELGPLAVLLGEGAVRAFDPGESVYEVSGNTSFTALIRYAHRAIVQRHRMQRAWITNVLYDGENTRASLLKALAHAERVEGVVDAQSSSWARDLFKKSLVSEGGFAALLAWQRIRYGASAWIQRDRAARRSPLPVIAFTKPGRDAVRGGGDRPASYLASTSVRGTAPLGDGDAGAAVPREFRVENLSGGDGARRFAVPTVEDVRLVEPFAGRARPAKCG